MVDSDAFPLLGGDLADAGNFPQEPQGEETCSHRKPTHVLGRKHINPPF